MSTAKSTAPHAAPTAREIARRLAANGAATVPSRIGAPIPTRRAAARPSQTARPPMAVASRKKTSWIGRGLASQSAATRSVKSVILVLIYSAVVLSCLILSRNLHWTHCARRNCMRAKYVLVSLLMFSAVAATSAAPAKKKAAAKPSDAELIASAKKAAPPSVAKGATIVTMEADGTMRTLLKGTNGFTCMPDNPGTPYQHLMAPVK